MPADEPTTSLEALYDLVPQAEEIDLRAELALESERRYWLRELRPLLGMLDLDLDLDASGDLGGRPGRPGRPDEPRRHREPDPDDEPWRLTDRQVVGMIEHVLGAEHLDSGADRDH